MILDLAWLQSVVSRLMLCWTAGKRRQRAFRHALVRVVLEVHRKHLFSHRQAVTQQGDHPSSTQAGTGTQTSKAASEAQLQGTAAHQPADGGNLGIQGQQRQLSNRNQAHSTADTSQKQPSQEQQPAAGGTAVSTEVTEAYDAIQAKAWHPTFQLEAVTVDECRAAAQKLADDKALQEVQDLGAPLPKVHTPFPACRRCVAKVQEQITHRVGCHRLAAPFSPQPH